MRLAPLARGVLLWAALGLSPAWARPPQEFKAPQEVTQEEIDASKARSKMGIHTYGKDAPVAAKPFPWAATLLFTIVFVIAAPFGWRHYRNLSKEIEEGEDAGRRSSRSQPGE